MLPGEGVLVVVVLGVEEVVFEAEPPAAPDEELPLRLDGEPPDEGVVLGTTTVTVTLGVVLVATTVPPLGLPAVPEPPLGLPVGPGWNAAYSIVDPAETR